MEHRALFRQLDRLVENTHATPDSESFTEALTHLGVQIRAHFGNEEAVMQSFGLPDHDLAAHVEAHSEILRQYTDLNLALMNEKKLERSKVLAMIKQWIIEHLLEHDVKIRRFIPSTS